MEKMVFFEKIGFFRTVVFVGVFLFLSCKRETPSENLSGNLSDLDRLYLSHRPPVGKVYVLSMSGASFEDSVLAASLQGVVNRKEARLYIIGGDAGLSRPWEKVNSMKSEEFWLNHYRMVYGLEQVKEFPLREAITEFRNEIGGWYLVSLKEPWTINAGTTLAGMDGSLIAFEENRNILDEAGIPLKESLIGRWRNSSECYEDLFRRYYFRMKSKGLGILSPHEYRLRDFLIQQGILTIYGRPTTEEWKVIQEILEKTEENLPVFGYLSEDGFEELLAVVALSERGKFLIPSDTTSNLSFHVSVVPSTRRNSSKKEIKDTVFCKKDNKLYVTVAITDGDNLIIPTNRYIWENFWNSPERGKIPMGFSLSLALFSVAPAVGEFYLSTRTEKDELIGMLGIGYVHPSVYPDKNFFFSRSFQEMKDASIRTFWTLDPEFMRQTTSLWDSLAESMVDGFPLGVLVGYFSLRGPHYFRTTKGIPVLLPISAYEDTPSHLAERVREILHTPPSQWPPVVFLSASSWNNPVDELVSVLKPLTEEGVNFLLPGEALGCVP